MEEQNNLVGKQIGNYYLIEEIESGSSCTVYRAHHIYLSNRIAALKVLQMHLPFPERDRFIQEAQFLESLHHPHILSVIDMGFDDGRPYLASEYASGGSLRQLLHERHLLSWDEALTILTQIGEALQYAHQQNIVHCDIKPENILFNAQGEALLADFGLATVLSTMSTKQLTAAEGTPLYMAPEQFHGQVSKESDQYALGCIAYELITGQEIFSAPDFETMGYNHEREQPIPPHQINPLIPLYIEQAILKALAKHRNYRHRDVAAFLTALHTSPQTTKEEWLIEGNALYNLKRYEDALSAYEQALRLDPNDADAYYGKGVVLENLQRYEEARGAYEHALDLDANDAATYTLKGAVLRDLAQYEHTPEAHEQALLLDPTTKLAALYDLGQYGETPETYEPALRLDPNPATAYNNKGVALCNLERYEEALEAYEQALRLDPNNADTYNNIGAALYHLEQYEDALEVYDQALRLDPNHADAYYSKSLTLDHLGRSREAQYFRKKARDLGFS